MHETELSVELVMYINYNQYGLAPALGRALGPRANFTIVTYRKPTGTSLASQLRI